MRQYEQGQRLLDFRVELGLKRGMRLNKVGAFDVL